MTNESFTMRLEQNREDHGSTGRWESDKRQEQGPTDQEEENKESTHDWERDKRPAGK